jgi:PAT family beta-lactamase induction signal transducer AmpG
MGVSNFSVGLTSGIAFFTMPQVLAGAHVSEATIAAITGAAMSSNFWPFIFGPILDIWFSRRFYATAFAALASALVVVAVMNLHHRVVLETALVLSVASAMLYTTALGGWFSRVCPEEEKDKLSAWLNIAVISGAGVTSALGGEFIRHLPIGLAAGLLGTIVFLPTVLFLFIPCPPPDARLAGETVSQFGGEILALLQRREVLIALIVLLSPCSSFALTNILGGLGDEFHASARVVSLAGGAGAFFPGLIGCLLFPTVARWGSLVLLYFADGVLGSLFTLSFIFLPHTPSTFALALAGEYFFQAIAFSIQVGIMFEVIGENNPLAATTFTLLSASTYVPITYMMLLDGKGYSIGGVTGSLAMDAGISTVSCVLIGLLLYKLTRRSFHVRGSEPCQCAVSDSA